MSNTLEGEDLKVPGALSAAIVTERIALLSTLKDLEGYDALRIVKWLASSLIITKEELAKERAAYKSANWKLQSVELAHADLRAKIEELLQNEE